MKKITIEEIINRHIESCSNFEAALEAICDVISELKKTVGDIQQGQPVTKNQIEEIKNVLTVLYQKRFSEEERNFLYSFVSSYIVLCDQLIEYISEA